MTASNSRWGAQHQCESVKTRKVRTPRPSVKHIQMARSTCAVIFLAEYRQIEVPFTHWGNLEGVVKYLKSIGEMK